MQTASWTQRIAKIKTHTCKECGDKLRDEDGICRDCLNEIADHVTAKTLFKQRDKTGESMSQSTQ